MFVLAIQTMDRRFPMTELLPRLAFVTEVQGLLARLRLTVKFVNLFLCRRRNWEAPKSRGQSSGELLSFSRRVVLLQPRIPLLELLPERAVEGSHPGLKDKIRAGLRPLHLLTLGCFQTGQRSLMPLSGLIGNCPRLFDALQICLR